MQRNPHRDNEDPYIGTQPLHEYYLTKKVGQGRIGSVYRAERDGGRDVYACKVIPEGNLKNGWQREVEKLLLLRRLPNIVQYHAHGSRYDRNERLYAFVIFDFIKGIDLRQYLAAQPSEQPWPLDIAFIEKLAETILTALHACRAVDIQHGDLHEGNILIEEPDPRQIGSPRTIWISDFGYGGSHNEVAPKDDYKQFFSIISMMLRKLDPTDLNPRDKVMHAKMREFLDKKVLEVDPTQGNYVGNPELLLKDFRQLAVDAERESAAAAHGQQLKQVGDYLVAEALGNRADEWQDLFVPEFLAARDLLSKNVAVLTGARGCGKTMSFRRLTAFMDKVIGSTSGVEAADQFVGFYLNCREFAEAFPWLPPKLNEAAEKQIIHYFHLAWLSEICKTLAIHDPNQAENFDWLDGFLSGRFAGRYQPLPKGANVLAHARAFIEAEKERCRIASLGKGRAGAWPLARFDLLDVLQTQLETHVPWVGEKSLYFFLDDYTIPIVPREVQRALNPIIFKKTRDKIFFKISTEAAISFDRRGFRGKPLEVFQDFNLIDLATESLHQEDKAKAELLDKIFRPRIDRHKEFKGKNLGLRDVLDKIPMSNNQLARQMRENAQSESKKKRIVYYGDRVFAGMWSSDIRTMIQMFTDILREANNSPSRLNLPIPGEIQNKVYRAKGGEFLVFAGSITDPSAWEQGPSSTKPGGTYGTHLVNIVEAFIGVSRDELTRGELVKNEGRTNPKQAFRLEILDKSDFAENEEAIRYYDGLIRWHIFLQDWRGKSVRGMITPRLYLNRVLIPHAQLTFSSRDNIHLTSQEFVSLLTRPKEFRKYWENKRKLKKREVKGRAKRDKPGDRMLWDSEEGQQS